jgi:hypothetical protein
VSAAGELERTVERLSAASRRQLIDPYGELDWPAELAREQWFFSPELVSLAGTGAWDALDEPARQRLSFFEAVNFFSLNIHGERRLVAGLAARLYTPRHARVSAYLHHFLDEENKHMVYFGGFCTRYAGRVYPEKKLLFPREFAPGEEDFLFFAKVLVFEELVDVFNQRMAADERLVPLVRRINLLHHREEQRHLVFGRQYVAQLFAELAPTWAPEVLARVRETLAQYLLATWREYANPEVYRAAGLAQPHALQRAALASPAARARWTEISARCRAYLLEQRILEAVP